MILRPMTAEDHEQFVGLHNRTYPTRTRTIEQVREADTKRDPKLAAGRWAAFESDRLVGFAGYAQWSGETHKDWTQIQIVVDKAFRRQGIGTALYEHILGEATKHSPKRFRADAYENLPSGLPFAQSLGFADVFREGPSHLDLDGFEAEAFAPLVDRLSGEGVEFISYGDLRKRDPGFADALYAAYRGAWQDVPKEEPSDLLRSDWNAWVTDSQDLDWEISTIALQGDRIVGFCEIGSAPEGLPVYAGLAGVERAERGRGIATAAYVEAIAATRAKGHPQMQTSSGVENVAMQTVYAKLGFAREPVWIQLEKKLS